MSKRHLRAADRCITQCFIRLNNKVITPYIHLLILDLITHYHQCHLLNVT